MTRKTEYSDFNLTFGLRLLTKAYTFRKDIGFLLYIGNFRNEIVFFCIF